MRKSLRVIVMILLIMFFSGLSVWAAAVDEGSPKPRARWPRASILKHLCSPGWSPKGSCRRWRRGSRMCHLSPVPGYGTHESIWTGPPESTVMGGL